MWFDFSAICFIIAIKMFYFKDNRKKRFTVKFAET